MKEPSLSKPYPLMPLRDIVLFPGVVAPLVVGRKKSIKALEYAMERRCEIFLITQKRSDRESPSESDLYRIGTLAAVMQLLRLPDGTIKALVEGRRRGRIDSFLHSDDFLFAEVALLPDMPIRTEAEESAMIRTFLTLFKEYAETTKKVPIEVLHSLAETVELSRCLDIAASHLPLKIEEKQRILSEPSASIRFDLLVAILHRELEIAVLEKNIQSKVKKRLGKSQRDYYLGEQLKAIKTEMGVADDPADDIKELEKTARRKKMPKAIFAKVQKELKKLKSMPPMSAESTVVRNYVDCILSLPWQQRSRVSIDLAAAERILAEDHYGLEKPKERILEYLAVQAQVKKIKGPILCLVGPPGVGKTSLSKSIARAMGRTFIRLSLGGVRDEAEIRGHRRTYIGAMPGKILQSMQRAGVVNPLFCLDEVDKMSMDFRGDPSAALLEVLDPEQNATFNDHYLAMDYDLSAVVFITTANTLPAIPPPLRDRMEIISLGGYTEDDKVSIAFNHLVPRQLLAHGFDEKSIRFSHGALREIIRLYTKEAGVRDLERSIAAICRKVARKRLSGKHVLTTTVNATSIQGYLGVPRYRFGQAESSHTIGMATGLAWTETGGELLQIETVLMPGKGKLTITGKLGEVMQESAQAALSYVRSRSLQLGLHPDFYQNLDIHIHVPEGAIPKDGPSAGITMAVSMVSALLHFPVRHNLAMTGEITLRGRVLPIGGLTQKLLAARRGSISHVLIPEENLRNLEDVPMKIRKNLQITSVSHMDSVLEKSLVIPEGKTLFQNVPLDSLFSAMTLPAQDTAH